MSASFSLTDLVVKMLTKLKQTISKLQICKQFFSLQIWQWSKKMLTDLKQKFFHYRSVSIFSTGVVVTIVKKLLTDLKNFFERQICKQYFSLQIQ